MFQLDKMNMIDVYNIIYLLMLIGFGINVVIGAIPMMYCILWGRRPGFFFGFGLMGFINATLFISLFLVVA